MNRGKPGSKIHAISDRNGLPLHAEISAANLNDHLLLEDMVDGIASVRQPVGRPQSRHARMDRALSATLPEPLVGAAEGHQGQHDQPLGNF